MKKFRFILLSACQLLLFYTAQATNPEAARLLVHTLNYLGGDYKHAVSNGQVISEDEYHEMLEFAENAEKHYADVAKDWDKAQADSIGILIKEIAEAVEAKADPAVVAEKARLAKGRIITASGLITYPVKYPDVANGKKLFATECARCHGNTGYGDGPEGIALEPKPRNFHDEERLSEISAAHAFNTIRLGVAGTGMEAHPQFEDEEVWDLAFYVLSLRYTPQARQVNTPEIPLEKLATLSDAELTQQFKLNKQQLAKLRLGAETESNDRFLKAAQSYLDRALESYRASDKNTALRYAALAYLEGIEPIELHLRSTDPELSEKIEHQFQNIRKLIAESRTHEELADSITAAKISIQEAEAVLGKKEYSFWLSLFMSLSIILREGLEAFLVLLVILSMLRAGNAASSAKWVHAGWVVAVAIGVGLWFAGRSYIPKLLASAEMVEGVISFIAVCMLLYIGFWLHGKSEVGKWKEYISRKVNGLVTEGSVLGLASLSFFVVFREVFESVLFLSALDIESGGKQSNAILGGVVLAFVLVVILAVLALRFSAKLPIPKLFRISSIVMGLLAVVLTGKGIHSFQEIGYLPVHGIPFIRVELLGVFPTLETTIGQGLMLLLLVVLIRKKS